MLKLNKVFLLICVSISIGDAVEVVPSEAVVEVGDYFEFVCKADYPLKTCSVTQPGAGSRIYLQPDEQATGGVTYYGRGLAYGECGARIAITKEWHGIVTCSWPPATGQGAEVFGTLALTVTSTSVRKEFDTVNENIVHLQQAVQELKQIISEWTPKFDRIANAVEPLHESLEELKQAMSLTTPAPPTCGNDTGYTYYPAIGSCYRLHETRLLWSEANTTCHEEGAHLAVANSQAEAILISSFKSKEETIIFIGYYLDSNGHWMTVTGETLEEAGYSRWGDGYPIVSPDIGYAGLESDGTLYSIASRYWGVPFLCEKPPQ